MKIYTYKSCDTCKKALKYLDSRAKTYDNTPIRETPPSKNELKQMLKIYNGNLKKLFNISGQDYRNLNLKEKIDSFTVNEAIDLLHSNGNLVKRPFLIDKSFGVVGFKLEEWDEIFS